MNNAIFITGIGTGIGKTLAAAITVSALHADYWKPVQAGNLDDTDSDWVREMTAQVTPTIHPESYRLTHAMSPHAAAARDNVTIEMKEILVPQTTKPLVIEGAGGIMVPLNNDLLIADLIQALSVPVLVVSEIYLGNINHTLLSIEALKRREIPIAGILFNGDSNPDTETVIEAFTNVPILGRIPRAEQITPQFIAEQATRLSPALHGILPYVS